MQKQILRLRQKGLSFSQIAESLNCSLDTVKYHLVPRRKQTIYRSIQKRTLLLKEKFGGKCSRCGYKTCADALCFHHINPKEKTGEVTHLLRSHSRQMAEEEAQKCVLVCSNCHAELHAGLWSI